MLRNRVAQWIGTGWRNQSDCHGGIDRNTQSAGTGCSLSDPDPMHQEHWPSLSPWPFFCYQTANREGEGPGSFLRQSFMAVLTLSERFRSERNLNSPVPLHRLVGPITYAHYHSRIGIGARRSQAVQTRSRSSQVSQSPPSYSVSHKSRLPLGIHRLSRHQLGRNRPVRFSWKPCMCLCPWEQLQCSRNQ
jgi:hypothetical protein